MIFSFKWNIFVKTHPCLHVQAYVLCFLVQVAPFLHGFISHDSISLQFKPFIPLSQQQVCFFDESKKQIPFPLQKISNLE